MKVFSLMRKIDVSGISGTGLVAHVIEFNTGKCVVSWDAPNKPHSVAVYDSIAEVQEIHLHEGMSELILIWDSGDVR